MARQVIFLHRGIRIVNMRNPASFAAIANDLYSFLGIFFRLLLFENIHVLVLCPFHTG